MTDTELKSDLELWSSKFKCDLKEHLTQLHQDATVCGFAIELPSDFGNDIVVSRVAKREEQESPIPELDDWDYLVETEKIIPNCERLVALYEKYDEQLDDDAFYDQFGNMLYAEILKVTQELVVSGAFPNFAIWLLTLSDDEHPVLQKAAKLLNDGAAQETAKRLVE